MKNLKNLIEEELMSSGADMVGIGDLTELPPDTRYNMPVGIGIVMKYSKEAIRSIADMPTKLFYEEYLAIKEKMDVLTQLGADILKNNGYEAIAQTNAFVQQNDDDYTTKMPHKTVATRAGLGWIGKSALLVTEKYGSMVRLSSVLTNAPLETAEPINQSQCGSCRACENACPAKAILGKNWSPEIYRDEFYNAKACRTVARQRALKFIGIEITQCGKCMEVCPYTRRYLES